MYNVFIYSLPQCDIDFKNIFLDSGTSYVQSRCGGSGAFSEGGLKKESTSLIFESAYFASYFSLRFIVLAGRSEEQPEKLGFTL